MSTPPLTWRTRLMLGFPLVCLLVVLASLGLDLQQVKRLEDPAWIRKHANAVDLRRVQRHEPMTFVTPHPDAEARVWFLGSSSIAVPHWDNFNEPMAHALSLRDRRVQFDNLGWEGMPSWNVYERALQAFSRGAQEGVRPDILVLYYGHNDVTYTYTYGLDLPQFDAVHLPLWYASGRAFLNNDPGHTYWMFCHRRAPRILDVLQNVGLLHLNPDHFAPLAERTLREYEKYTDKFVQLAQQEGVRLLLVTPTGNLSTKPFGVMQQTDVLWRNATATQQLDERIDGFIRAKDTELFTPDMRAKSTMLDSLRRRGPSALDGPAQVSVCDVESLLRERGATFDQTMFLDPLHFSDEGYRQLTDVLADCLHQGPLQALR